jgi:alpha-L-rhamnosidase
MTKKFIYLLFVVISLIACNREVSSPPINLRTEEDNNPINIDKPNPSFSWQFADSSNGFMQKAYQIVVATSEELLTDKGADIWNTGKVNSDQSQFIIFSGKPLEPTRQYYWAVQIWDSTGKATGFSHSASFETGLLSSKNWKASWIKAPTNLNKAASVLFRKEFQIDKKLKVARIYATGINAYFLYVNGQSAGKQRLSPGWTIFDKRIQYQVYEVTSLLHEGSNALGAMVGNFWNGTEDLKPINELKFIAQIKLEYNDGSIDWIYSGKGWKAHSSPVLECSFNGGEKYDAGLEINNWNQPGPEGKGWMEVLTEKNISNLVGQQMQPVVVKQEIKAVKIIKLEDGKFVADMGESLPGWVRIKVKCKPGRTVKLMYMTTFNSKENKIGKIVGTDEYSCKSSDFEEWEPTFAYHVFRFVEISGLSYRPDTNTLVARVAYTDLDNIGSFNCSNELINKIFRNIERTGRNNLVSILTGLPDYESRVGSPVSVQAFGATAHYLFNMNKAFSKYMNDLGDLQISNGKILFLPGNGAGTNSPGWSDVMAVLPWQSYLASGDKRILSNNYNAINSWHNSQVRESEATSPPYMHDREGKGDVYSLDSTRVKPIGSCYYFYTTTILSNIADALGKPDESTSFMELAGFTKDQFNQSFLTYRISRYWSLSQTAHILPLAVGLTPLSHAQRVADFIASDIKKKNIHLTTGVLTTQFLLPLLSEYKHHKLAYQLFSQVSQPSWGYMTERGSSTIWGSWDGNEDASMFQLALASAGEWLFAYLAGIRPDLKFTGFKHSIIDPEPVGDLKWVKSSVQTEYGKLAASWEKQGNNLLVIVEIPQNTWSTLMLPVKSNKDAKIILGNKVIMENRKATLDCPSYIKFKGFDANMAVFDVGSGNYKFLVE